MILSVFAACSGRVGVRSRGVNEQPNQDVAPEPQERDQLWIHPRHSATRWPMMLRLRTGGEVYSGDCASWPDAKQRAFKMGYELCIATLAHREMVEAGVAPEYLAANTKTIPRCHLLGRQVSRQLRPGTLGVDRSAARSSRNRLTVTDSRAPGSPP